MGYDPFLGSNPVIAAMEQRRGYVEQLRQNTSRLAQSYNFVVSEGIGMIKLATVVRFHCTFTQKPVVGYGYTVETPLLADDFPASTGGVYGWAIDSRGFYQGAYVFVVVTATSDPVIQHDFTFTGIAMKDLPEHLLDI